ncbi:MAG: iron-containing alcohol dehydrogenase, partial [Opitutaceae bacterium]
MPANPSPLSRFMGRHKIPNAGLPVFAIPTTAGTGSEVTRVAVITDTKRDVKMMMLDQHLLPTVALLDFELTLSMPAALTAAVGVDTLTHGIEAYGSVVELNVDADILVDFSPVRRAVRLVRGEAHFTVATDAARPFVVSAGGVEVRAVGTGFAVHFAPQEIAVLVTEGQVA